jgi:hypothetical protein
MSVDSSAWQGALAILDEFGHAGAEQIRTKIGDLNQ